MKYNQALLGVVVTLFSLLLGYHFTKQSEYVIVHDNEVPFSSQTEFIPMATFSYDSLKHKTTRITVELEVRDVEKVDQLLLVLERNGRNNENLTWEKKELGVITTTNKSNRMFYNFKYVHDSVILKTNSVKLYLWNKGKNKGVLANYRIILR